MPQLDYGTTGHKGLSYSRRGDLHRCARYYQLQHSLGFATRTESVTFSYGHAVAAGVQEYFRSGDEKLAIACCVKDYAMPWSDAGTTSEQRGKKNIWYAIDATTKYIKLINSLLPNSIQELKDYEIAEITLPTGETVPAVELQFRVLLNDGFVYEGHIDLVVRNKKTGKFAVLELKTTVFRDPHDALYGNSDQALSYSIVIDTLLQNHGQTSYKVYYLIYSSSEQDWILKVFTKEVKRRFDWINNLIRDCEMIEYYESSASEGIPYPTNGASCYEFFRPCRFYGSCTMDDESLAMLYAPKKSDDKAFDETDRVHFEFTIDEIIETQINMAEERSGFTSVEHVIDEI